MKVEGVPGEPSDGRFYTVIGSDENHVFLDGNHPFAGWALKFVVRVLKVEKATPEEVEEMEAPEPPEVAGCWSKRLQKRRHSIHRRIKYANGSTKVEPIRIKKTER